MREGDVDVVIRTSLGLEPKNLISEEGGKAAGSMDPSEVVQSGGRDPLRAYSVSRWLCITSDFPAFPQSATLNQPPLF